MERILLRVALEELESETEIVPPVPATMRGRFGRKLIALEARAFWWIVRAFRIRDRALKTSYAAMMEQERRFDALEEKVAGELSAIQARLRSLESRSQDHSDFK
jgi:hypothetical protein